MSNQRKKILFFAEDVTLAHIARPLALADALDPNRYEVHLAVSDRSAHFARDARFAIKAITPSIHSIRTISPQVFLDGLATGKAPYTRKVLHSYVHEDMKTIETVQPDLVIGDFRLSLQISAKLKGIPHATLVNFHWSPFARIPRSPIPDLSSSPLVYLPESWANSIFRALNPFFLKAFLRPINQARSDFGLPSLQSLEEVYCMGDNTLYMDIPGTLPSAALPPGHRMIGAPLWSPPVPNPPWWDELTSDRKTIYLSLGSSGQVRLLPALVRVLSELPIHLMISTAGRADLDSFPRDQGLARLWIHPYLPGSLAARRSDLVICNGGASTAYQALAEGTPILGIPSNVDQHLTLIHPVEQGAARMIRSDRFNPKVFKSSVESILGNSTYRTAARELSARFQAHPAEKLFPEWIQEALGT